MALEAKLQIAEKLVKNPGLIPSFETLYKSYLKANPDIAQGNKSGKTIDNLQFLNSAAVMFVEQFFNGKTAAVKIGENWVQNFETTSPSDALKIYQRLLGKVEDHRMIPVILSAMEWQFTSTGKEVDDPEYIYPDPVNTVKQLSKDVDTFSQMKNELVKKAKNDRRYNGYASVLGEIFDKFIEKSLTLTSDEESQRTAIEVKQPGKLKKTLYDLLNRGDLVLGGIYDITHDLKGLRSEVKLSLNNLVRDITEKAEKLRRSSTDSTTIA